MVVQRRYAEVNDIPAGRQTESGRATELQNETVTQAQKHAE